MVLTDAQTRDEQHERQHLAETLHLLTTELKRLTGDIDKSARTIDERKKHLWDNLIVGVPTVELYRRAFPAVQRV